QGELFESNYTDTTYCYYNFVQIENNVYRIFSSSELKSPENVKNDNKNKTCKQTFDILFEPFYELLLNDMNKIRELRIVERNKEKSKRGRPTSKQLNTNEKTKYQKSFSKPFTKNDLLSFLACFYRICTINSKDIRT